MSNFRLQLAVFACLCAMSSTALANFEVSPFVLKLRADKGQLSGWFEVKPNQDKRPVAVELSVLKRSLDLDGKELNDSVQSTELTIYPSELVVYPGEKAKVQVVWSGSAPPVMDQAFTVLATEVPVEAPKKEPTDKFEIGIKTLVRYRLIVAVETQKRGNLMVVSTRKMDSGKVEIITENKGAGRIPMEGFHLLIAGKKYSDLPGMTNAIMPGEKRRFIVPIPNLINASEIHFGAADGPIK